MSLPKNRREYWVAVAAVYEDHSKIMEKVRSTNPKPIVVGSPIAEDFNRRLNEISARLKELTDLWNSGKLKD